MVLTLSIRVRLELSGESRGNADNKAAIINKLGKWAKRARIWVRLELDGLQWLNLGLGFFS
tara:strand:- start:35 stop:217 length:183 start_codon:yes stop_codon:yes gene_type:complete